MRVPAAAIAATLCAGAAAADTVAPPADSFAGDYAVVGQAPDGGPPYAGRVEMRAAGAGVLKVRRLLDGSVASETARLEETTHPPGVTVLNFYAGGAEEGGALAATCLWQIDLDNYARLTCLRGDPAVNEIPGREALFPLH